MSVESLTEILLQYRYWILIPLSIIEGPLVAFVAGTMAAVGYFNIYFLCLFFFIRDIGLDAAYYALGHFGGRTSFSQKMLRRLRVTSDHLEEVRDLWVRRPGMTMFIGKLSYGIASAFIVVAGMVKMPLRIFFAYGALIAVLQYGVLLMLGYFLGATFGSSIAHIIENVQYALAIAAVVLTGYYVFTWYMRGKLLDAEMMTPQGDARDPGSA